MKIKTILEVLDNLPPNDGRRDWWEDMVKRIATKDYFWVLMRLAQHRHDIDFVEQVEIIAQAITYNRRMEGK